MTPVSGYYGDPRDSREYRERYARDARDLRDDRNYQYYSRDHPSSSRTRSPPDDRREDGYYSSRRERDIHLRDRDPYGERRADAFYGRDRYFDREAAYATRGIPRDLEREREREYYDRDPRQSRGYADFYQDVVEPYGRPPSPYGSRKSPSLRGGPISPQPPSRHPQSPPYERRESIPSRHSSQLVTEETLARDVAIPTGPRGAPTGPRHSFGRPPPLGPNTGLDNRGVGPSHTVPSGPSFDGPPRSMNRRVDEEGVPLSAIAAPLPGALSTTLERYPRRDDDESFKKDVDMSLEPKLSSISTLDVPVTATDLSRQASSDVPPKRPIKERLGNLDEVDFKGSGCAEAEAKVSQVEKIMVEYC